MESKVQPVNQHCSDTQGQLRMLQDQMFTTLMKLEDLENYSCRDNIRIKSLKEDVESSDLEGCMQKLFGSLLPEGHAQV